MARIISTNSSIPLIASSAVATTAVDNITMAIWVNSAGANSARYVAYNGNSITGYGIQVDASASNQVAVAIGGVNACDSSTVLTNGVWTHIAIVRNAGTWTMYFNGVGLTPSNSTSNSTPNAPSGASAVGNFSGSGQNSWQGTAADYAIWNTPLSGANITALSNGTRPIAVNSANLVIWWPLDGFASPETDASGNGLSGTVASASQTLGPPQLWRISG